MNSIRSSSQIEAGRALLERGETDQAITAFEEAARLDEDNPDVFYLLGLSHARAGHFTQAIDVLSRAISIDPAHIEARHQLALLYENYDHLDKAIEEYSGVIQWADPDSDLFRSGVKKLRYLTATQHAKKNELDRALTLFDELSEAYPDDALISYSAGVAYMLKGRMSEARDMYERTLRNDPSYLNAYLNLATVDEVQGRLEAAVKNLKHIIEAGIGTSVASRASVRLNIIEARILTQGGNLLDALSAYHRALEIDPSNNVSLQARPGLYRRLNDKEGERNAYEDLIEHYPGDLPARNRLAEIYLADNRYADAYDQIHAVLDDRKEDAEKDAARKLLARMLSSEEGKSIERIKTVERVALLEARLQQNPGDTAAMLDLAILYFRQEKYQDSIEILERLSGLRPDDESVHLSLAALHDKLGQFSESVREYVWLIARVQDEEAVSRYVSSMRLANAKRLFIAGDLQTAGREFSDLLADEPENSIAYFYLGLIYSREDDNAGAVDAYREVVRQIPTHVGARLNLAYSYERLNREEDAIDEYRKILQANPPGEMEQTVKLRLRNLQRRINGVTVGIGYSFAYDSNSNLSDIDASEELRSDLSLNLSYQYKTERGYRWRLSAQPAYSNYHEGQYDYLNTSETLAVSAIRDALTLVGGYTYRTTDGILVESRLSRMHTVFGEVLSRVKLPNLFRRGELVSSGVTLNLSYSDFDSSSSPFFSSYTTAGGLTISQPATGFDTFRLGYIYVINDNKELVGSDYAYTSHGLSMGLDHIMPWGGINLNLGFTVFDYANLDSFSQFTDRRRNARTNVALGLTYRYKPDISLFASLAWTDNRSNLPVGFILNSEDIIEGQQSSSLSDYRRTMLTTGINLRF
ncbi:MAG: tetratricopeptide repeat protein [Nitrospiraceae bacterium]